MFVWLLAFLLTAVETSVGAFWTKSYLDNHLPRMLAWGLLFEALLLADYKFIKMDDWLALPILGGAAVGISWLWQKQRQTKQRPPTITLYRR